MDILYIKSIDRLGRNYHEILEEWRFLTREKYVDIVVFDMPLLDTRIGKDLTETLISDLVLQILFYVAESEYQNIKQCQREGILAAKNNGVTFGHPRIEVSFSFYLAAERWNKGGDVAEGSGQGVRPFLIHLLPKGQGGKGLLYEIGIINRKTVFFDHRIMALTKHSAFHYIKNSLAIIPIFSISKSDFLKRSGGKALLDCC